MHKTEAGEKRKALTRNAWELARDAKALQKATSHLPAVSRRHNGCKKKQMRLWRRQRPSSSRPGWKILQFRRWKSTNETKKGSKTYVYWMASWSENGKTRNVHLWSSRKMDAESALQKARMMKEEASMLIELTRGKYSIIDVNVCGPGRKILARRSRASFSRQLYVLCSSPQRYKTYHPA
jgi:hypothetical protein